MLHKRGLKATYYAWFFLLVVLPIILIILSATLFLINREFDEAAETIDTLHHSVASTLESEVREASLGLAYFLLGNDQEMAALLETAPASQAQRYANTRQLQKVFEYFAFQDKDIEALHLYLTDGTYYALSTQLALPAASVQEEACFQRAMQTPNQITVGSVNPDLLHYATTHHGEVLLCAAMSLHDPRMKTALSVAGLYFSTSAEEMIASYNDSMPAARSFLVEGSRVLDGDTAIEDAEQCLLSGGLTSGAYDWYRLTTIPHTQLGILTLVSNQQLFASYYTTLGAILLAILLILFLFALYTRLFFHSIIQPLDELSRGMARLQSGDFSHRLKPQGHAELQRLEENFNVTSARMEALIAENQAQENEKYHEELKALQSEINPHFLLNTVNTIRFMAEMAHYDSIRDMAASLMEILRCILRNPNERYTLADELRLLRSYVAIMEVRLPGVFSTQYDVPPECLNCRIPKLLLQPLVENAIQHAFADMETTGVIRVSARFSQERLVLEVADNGSGIPPEKLAAWKQAGAASLSIGMANVKRRLELNCGDCHAMDIASVPGEGTRITLSLPVSYLSKGDPH